MSGEEILTAVLQDMSKDDKLAFETSLKRFDTFQRSVLTDLLVASAEPENYIWSEEKEKIIRTTLETMNQEQKAALYMLVGYAQAMFAH